MTAASTLAQPRPAAGGALTPEQRAIVEAEPGRDTVEAVLLYTALTRATAHVVVIAPPELSQRFGRVGTSSGATEEVAR